ncbi:translation initiation factor [Candidatus Woesearchaeota archaeon]|nr:translation initiation factor [Candidatus Woesearchaeota archaeon]
MSEICSKCGLPKELCVCEAIARESQEITISLDKKKFGKTYTVVRGIDEKEINLDELIKKLKSKLACGGTAKEGRIELQGSHTQRTKEILLEFGFPPGRVVLKK